jgi:hypothetical protein
MPILLNAVRDPEKKACAVFEELSPEVGEGGNRNGGGISWGA